MFLSLGAARGQQSPSQQGGGDGEQTPGGAAEQKSSLRAPWRGGGIVEDNLDRVAATAEQILEVVNRDAGLMVELKRAIAQDAGESGQILEESDLSESAVAERLHEDLRIRVLATRLLERYGYLLPLLMVGDGPDRAELERRYSAFANIVWCGNQLREKVIDLIAASKWLVLPSLVYENFSMSVLEALSVGTPVIVPNHGSFAAIVSDGVEGLFFSAGDATSLSTTLQTALDASEGAWTQWSANARNKHLSEYTARSNYAQLMSIYQEAAETYQRLRGRARYPEIAEAAGPIVKERVREQ